MHLGLKIKLLRISKGLTQEDLADKVNKTRPLISAVEQTGKVSPHTLKKICEVLEVDEIEFDNIVNEPLSVYKATPNPAFEEKLQVLQKEIDHLNRLVSMQQDLIEALKDKIETLAPKPKKN